MCGNPQGPRGGLSTALVAPTQVVTFCCAVSFSRAVATGDTTPMRISFLGQWSESMPPLPEPEAELNSVFGLLQHADQAEEAYLLLASVAYLRAALETQLRDLAATLEGKNIDPRGGTAQALQVLRKAGYLTTEQQQFIGLCHARASALLHNRSNELDDYAYASQGIRFAIRALQSLEGGAE